MKTFSWIPLAAFSFVLVTACQQDDGPRTQNRSSQIGSNNYGYQPATPGTATDFVTQATPTPTPSPNATDTVPGAPVQPPSVPPTMASSTTNATATTSSERTLPVATPVEGMPGYVTSPFSPYAGYVDVRGYPPNTQVKDPYSGKIFLVP